MDKAPSLSRCVCGNDEEIYSQAVYRIVHDLRASVRAIAELPDWIQEDLEEAGLELPNEPARAFELLRSHANKLNLMLNDLSQLSLAFEKTTDMISLRDCFDKALACLTLTEGTRVRAFFKPDQIQIPADTLTFLFTSLLRNAICHNTGPLHIAVICKKRNGIWEMIMRDNGCGIPTAQHDQVFLPMTMFSDVDRSGAGMGLALIKKFAEEHSGTAKVIAPHRPRHGATIKLTLKS